MFRNRKNHPEDGEPADKPQRGKTTKGRAARKTRAAQRQAQNFVWFEAMRPDGICVLGGGKFSVTLRLADINYQMATEERQRALLERYAQFFNSFSTAEQIQITIINRRVERDLLLAKVLFPEPRHGDRVSRYRADHNRIVREKIGTQGFSIVAEKYLTLTVAASTPEQATAHLNRLSESVITHMWSLLECQARRVDGAGRIQLLRELTRGCYGGGIDYKGMAASLATSRDEIAPMAVDLTNSHHVVLTGDTEERHVQTLVMRNYPAWMSDSLFKKLSEVQVDLVVGFHVNPIDRGESKDLVLKSQAALDMQKISERAKLRKANLDPEDLSHKLQRSLLEVGDLLHDIETADQRLFTTTMVVTVFASSPEELATRVAQVHQVAKAESCELVNIRFFQQQGFNTALPLGESWIPIHRTLTTAATAVMVPFTSQEILDDGGLFYGLNPTTANPIIGDRRRTRNGNAFVVGTSGSGKSHFSKWEISEVLLGRPDDEVIIIDPEREYKPLADVFGATNVEIHAGSSQVVNPFDIVVSNVEGDPVRLKAEALLGMLGVLLGGTSGLSAAQQSILDRSITALYARFMQDPTGLPTPTFADLHDELRRQPEPEAAALATSLELYAKGSFSGFSQQTNVDTSNRFIYYDISKLGEHMKTFGMMVVLDAVWQRVLANFGRGIRTWLYIDEFQIMFTNPLALAMFKNFYKRARKYGLLPTGITQNVEELLSVPDARLMLSNCDCLFLLGQQKADADELAVMLDLSEAQIRAFTNVEPGCGLIRFGSTTLSFNARKPTDGPLAELFNTQFQD